jgi:hypothetical protein
MQTSGHWTLDDCRTIVGGLSGPSESDSSPARVRHRRCSARSPLAAVFIILHRGKVVERREGPLDVL